MQPHSHSSRDAEAPWASPDAKPKKRAKKTAAKKKPVKKPAAKKPAAKKKTAAAKTAKSSKSVKPAATVADHPVVATLRSEVGALEQKIPGLEQRLVELSIRVADLTAARSRVEPDTDGGEEDLYLRWLGDPSIEQYIGQHVALHATRGVVAHADSVAAVIESVHAQGLSPDDVCLTTVPARSSLEPSDAGEAIENPFARWLRDPSIAQYHDQHIALHRTLGVVAHGASLDAVLAEVRAKGIPVEEIALDFISGAPF
jgi:hypothetical protein